MSRKQYLVRQYNHLLMRVCGAILRTPPGVELPYNLSYDIGCFHEARQRVEDQLRDPEVRKHFYQINLEGAPK